MILASLALSSAEDVLKPTWDEALSVLPARTRGGDAHTRELAHTVTARDDWTPGTFTTAELLAMPCRPLQSFTWLQFDEQTTLVSSNLGGQGGRCADIQWNDGSWTYWDEFCDEEQPAVNTVNNMHLLFRGVGVKKDYASGSETVVWLRITNETE